MALDLTLPQILQLTGRVIIALVCLGTLAYYLNFQPALYVDVHDRSNLLGGVPARGFFPHKITAALYAVMGFVAISATATSRVKLVLAFLVTVWFILLTGSATGLVLAVAAMLLRMMMTTAIRTKLSRGAWFLGLVAATAVFGGVLSLIWTALLTDLGRDATLTGRTTLWQFGIQAFLQRPFGGWGFTAYFNSDQWTIIQRQVTAFSNYDVPHFHESFIQTAVDFGIPGLVAVVWSLCFIASRSYVIALKEDAMLGVAIFVLVGICTLAGTAMFILINYNHFATFFVAVLLFALVRRQWAGSRSAEAPQI